MTKKTLPRKITPDIYRCGDCGAVVFPCEKFCDECYSEIDWTNYQPTDNSNSNNEELFPLSEMRQPN